MSEEPPRGWAMTTLKDAGTWSSGGTPSRKNLAYFGGVIPWVKSGDLNDGLLTHTDERITATAIKESSARVFPKGTVSMAMYGATIGKLAVFDIDAATNQACVNCRAEAGTVEPWFLFYYLMSQREAFIAAGQGGAQPNISASIVKDWPLPLPPLAEQRRIVEKVVELLVQVNAAKHRLSKVPAILKRFRQSVLAAACSGRLTGNLLESGEDVPSSWQWSSLDELVVPGGIFDGARDHGSGTAVAQNLRTQDYTSSGVRVVRLENLANLAFIAEKHTYISEEKYAGLKQNTVYEGDILFGSFIEESVRVCLMPKLDTPAIAKADCFCIRVRSGAVNPEYLVLQLACKRTHAALGDEIHGATRSRINTKQLRAIRVPLCSIEEQQTIVSRVSTLFAVAAEIEQRTRIAMSRTDQVPQAILAKAFRGELVPTEAELARAEGREYETAEQLLARVRTTVMSSAPNKRQRPPTQKSGSAEPPRARRRA